MITWSTKKISGVWNNIVSIKKELNKQGLDLDDLFKLKIKSNENTQFWCDGWLGSTTLKAKYPDLYELESRKNEWLLIDF